MIIENRATEIGDVLYIQTETPLIGLIALSSFIDDTVGEITNRTFSKTFRYSVDGITWTAFVPLTDANLAGVQVQSNDTFYAEYRYERSGTDASGELEFNSVTLNGAFTTITDGPVYTASIFNNYFNFNNICSIAWSVNVLEKLYQKGIIPKYIERNLTGENLSDRDFLDFWRAITHYFALYVCLAREFQFFYQNKDLLLEYLSQRGVFVCNDTELVDLLYIMSNYYDEIRQRGTRQVFKPKATDTSVEGSRQVDGEYLRMICYNVLDEFIVNLNQNKHIGWNIGNSSPLYRGLEDRLNVNKYPVDSIRDVNNIALDLNVDNTSLSYISISDNSTSASSSVTPSDDYVIIAPPPPGTPVGLGKGDQKIIINPNIDYEITFFIRSKGAVDPTFTFGVDAYDKDDNFIALLRNDVTLTSNEFLTGVNPQVADRFLFVRGILFNKNNYKTYSASVEYKAGTIVRYLGTPYRAKRDIILTGTVTELGTVNSTPGYTAPSNPYIWDFWQQLTTQEVSQQYVTSLGIGNNLCLMDNVVKISPYILYENSAPSTAELHIKEIRVQPLSTPYSKGFIQMSNFLELWGTNNNLSLSEQKVNANAKHYLLPYNTILQNNFIPTEIN